MQRLCLPVKWAEGVQPPLESNKVSEAGCNEYVYTCAGLQVH